MAAFYAVGAYTSALLATRLHWCFWLPYLQPGWRGVAGLIIGLLSLRLRKFFLAITTIAFGEIVRLLLLNWVPVTRGPMGITGIPAPTPIRVPVFGLIMFSNKVVLPYTDDGRSCSAHHQEHHELP